MRPITGCMTNSSLAETPADAPKTEIETPNTKAHTEPAEWKPTADTQGRVRPYDEYEAEIFRFALARAGGCVSRAAEMLRVGRATMYRKMRAYGIDVPPVSERAIDRSRRPSLVRGEVAE